MNINSGTQTVVTSLPAFPFVEGTPAMRSADRESSSIVEIELTDPAAIEHMADGPDLLVRLEAAYPGDPGELSGLILRIMDSGKYVRLNAEFGAPQRDGRVGSHCFGSMDASELHSLVAFAQAGRTVGFALHDLYAAESGTEFSGVMLTLSGSSDRSIRIGVGSHCMGVLTGSSLDCFLRFAEARCKGVTAAARV